MAIEQKARVQVACKVVDLRPLMETSKYRFGAPERPEPVQTVDNRTQLCKVKTWADRQKRETLLGDKLKLYFREVEILSSISHVSLCRGAVKRMKLTRVVGQPNIIGVEKVYVTDNTM
jgi:hypothetical protein